MLIGTVMEETPQVSAMENMANRLSDRIRNIWLRNTGLGLHGWEESFFEDPDGVAFLREESFPDLQGIDYIFKWWNSDDAQGLAGCVEVLWKVRREEAMKIYKTTLRLAIQDFQKGAVSTEEKKREAWRAEFREAFAIWHELYLKKR